MNAVFYKQLTEGYSSLTLDLKTYASSCIDDPLTLGISKPRLCQKDRDHEDRDQIISWLEIKPETRLHLHCFRTNIAWFSYIHANRI